MYTLRINAYRYVQYIHIQYIYIYIYICRISRYHVFQHILICHLCFTAVCLTSVDQKGSMFYNGLPDLCGSKRFSNDTSWMDFLGEAAYDSGLNEDSVL